MNHVHSSFSNDITLTGEPGNALPAAEQEKVAVGTAADAAPAVVRNVVFIDPSVSDYATLVKDIAADTRVVVLDAHREAFQQMADALAGLSNLDSVQVVSHGGEGNLYIAGRSYWTEGLEAHATQLQAIGSALKPSGDILFYACDLAGGARGGTFLDTVHRLTGADVAASSDGTGNQTGENWALEAATGAIEAVSPFAAASVAAFTGRLATQTVTSATDGAAGSLRNTITAATAGDIIVFDPTLKGQTLSMTNSTGVALTINKSITINGDVDGDGIYDVTLSGNLDGSAANTLASGSDAFGFSFNAVGGSFTVKNLHFDSFRTTVVGGAVGLILGTLEIDGSSFSYNAGNAISQASAVNNSLTVRNSTVTNSGATISTAGALYAPIRILHNTGASTTIENVVVANNSYTLNLDGASNTAAFGGIVVSGVGSGDVNLTVRNTTVANNTFVNTSGLYTAPGGGISVYGAIVSANNTLNVYNTIIADNTATNNGTLASSSASNSITNSSGKTVNITDIGNFKGVTNGTTVAFVNAAANDFRPKEDAAALIGAGDSSNTNYYASGGDIRGLERIRGGTLDIGAYEVQWGSGNEAAVDLDTGTGGNNAAITVAAPASGAQVFPALSISEPVDHDGRLLSATMVLTGASDGASETLALTAAQISAARSLGIAVTSSNGQTLLLTGANSLANYQTVLGDVTYHNAAGSVTSGTRTVTLVINDGELSTTRTSSLTVAPQAAANTAPSIANLGGDTLAYTASSGARVIDQGTAALVTDSDSVDFDTGTLTVAVTGATADDVLGIRNQGTGAGQIGISGSTISYGGTAIGTFTGGGGSDLVVTFNSSSTAAAASALLANITYATASAASASRTVSFTLTDGDGGTSAVSSATITVAAAALAAPTVTDARIALTSTGTGTGGVYKIGDTVTATWDNTAAGDNNAGLQGVTFDFSQFGGGAAVPATETNGIWTASYTLTAGSIDTANRNVSVTATNASGPATAADSTNASVDNIAPSVTAAKITLSGASGTGGAFKTGDTVTATWDNTVSGDSNNDTLVGVSFDFSDFGGSRVVATNSMGLWTATYTIAAGSINSVSSRNVSATVTDNAGNATTRAGTTNAVLDNQAPAVTSVSASTADGAYKPGTAISIQVSFGEAVTVSGGAPVLALGNGASATYTSGSGSSTLTFSYTVATGEDTPDLDFASTTALALAGATLRDATGNNAVLTLATPGAAGSLGANKNIVIDTLAPAAPAVTSPAATSQSAPTLAGTAEAGTTITVTVGGATYTTTATGGAWSIDLAVATPTAGTLSLNTSGNNPVSVTAADAAGNVSSSGTQTLAINSSVPAAPVVTSADLTRQATPTLTGTAEAGTTINVTIGGATYTTTATGGTWSVDLSMATPVSGALSLNANGTNAVSVTATNSGGTTSQPGTQTLTIDTTPPGQTFSAIGLSDDTGASTTDHITKTAAQTLSATLSATLDPGDKVWGSLDGGATWTDITSKVSGTTLTWNGATLLQGQHAIQLKVSDAAGNDGTADSQNYVLDTTGPTFNPATSSPADDASGITTGTTLVLNFGERLGSFDIAKIQLHDTAAGTTVAISASIDASGRLVITPTAALKAGTAYHMTWNADAILDVAGNAAAALNNATTFNFTTASGGAPTQPTEPSQPTQPSNPTQPTQPTAPTETVDGATVTTTTRTDASGVTTTTQTVAPVTAARTDDPSTTHSALADVPLAKDANGNTLVQVGLPVGVGLTADASVGANLTLRDKLIAASQPRTLPNDFAQVLQQGIDAYVPTVTDQSQVTVRTLTLNMAPGTTVIQPIVVQGAMGSGEGDALHPLRQEALVVDARALPAGSVLDLSRVEFAIVIGAVRVIGGEGRNFATGDGSAQWMVLGADDDVLHGGAGDDTIGSLGGNDQVFGDAGNDIVFGGTGNDMLLGGTGNDRLDGGLGWDTALQSGALADYTLAIDHEFLVLTHKTTGEVDRLKSIETVQFDTGANLYIADSDAEAALAHIATRWLGRELTAEEGVWAQKNSQLSDLQVAQYMLGAHAAALQGHTAQELIAGWKANAQIVRMQATPELVQGTAGLDQIPYGQRWADVHLARTGTDRWEGTSLINGDMAEFVGIERLRLNDVSVALDTQGTAGKVAALLSVTLGNSALADRGLAGEGLKALDAGMSVQAVGEIAMRFAQTQQGHPFTAQETVQWLWKNATGSAGTQEQLQPYVQQLQSGQISGGDLVNAAMQHALANPSAQLVGVLDSGLLYLAAA